MSLFRENNKKLVWQLYINKYTNTKKIRNLPPPLLSGFVNTKTSIRYLQQAKEFYVTIGEF